MDCRMMPTLSSNSCWTKRKSPSSTENPWEILRESIHLVMEKLLQILHRIYWMILKNLPNQAQWLRWISPIMVTNTSMVSNNTNTNKTCKIEIWRTMEIEWLNHLALKMKIERCHSELFILSNLYKHEWQIPLII